MFPWAFWSYKGNKITHESWCLFWFGWPKPMCFITGLQAYSCCWLSCIAGPCLWVMQCSPTFCFLTVFFFFFKFLLGGGSWGWNALEFKIQLHHRLCITFFYPHNVSDSSPGVIFSACRWASRITECIYFPKLNSKQCLSGTDQNRSFGRKTGVLWKLCQPPSPCFKGNSAKSSRFDTPPPSVCFTLVSIWNEPVRFLISPPPSSRRLHTHLPLFCTSLQAAVFVWPPFFFFNWLNVSCSRFFF